MKEFIFRMFFITFFSLVLSTCVSVNSKGIEYFVGRSENDLINHFGYSGIELESSDIDYDKILFFTNRVLKYHMSKVNTVRYKTSRQTELMVLSFNEFSDGCIVDALSRVNYGMHIYDSAGTVRHTNNNSEYRPLINEFNSIINRNNAYPMSQRNSAFDRYNIGDTYYLYERNSESGYRGGVTGKWQSETYTHRLYGLWRIDLVAENRSETESYIVGQYNERQDRYYTGNGNSVTTLSSINNTVNDYTNRGFTHNIAAEGNSMLAFITNGKVIKVDGNTSNLALMFYNKGKDFFDREEWYEAYLEYTNAILLNPNYTAAFGSRARVLYAVGDYEGAIDDNTQAIGFDPDAVWAYFNRGLAYYMIMDYNKAIADFETILQIDPNNTGARELLQDIRQKLSR